MAHTATDFRPAPRSTFLRNVLKSPARCRHSARGKEHASRAQRKTESSTPVCTSGDLASSAMDSGPLPFFPPLKKKDSHKLKLKKLKKVPQVSVPCCLIPSS